MRKNSKLLALAFMAIASLSQVGCDKNTSEAIDSTPTKSLVTLDDYLAQITEEVPGFGGFYVNENGKLIIYRTEAGKQKAQKQSKTDAQLLQTAVSSLKDIYRSNFMGGGENAQKTVDSAFEEAKYDYTQLQNWFKEILQSELPNHLMSIDIDENNNRINFGVASQADISKVNDELVNLKIPNLNSRFTIEPVSIIDSRNDELPLPKSKTSSTTLYDLNQKTLGGYAVNIDTDKPNCTIGFNVTLPNNTAFGSVTTGTNQTGFFTASHCTNSTFWIPKSLFWPNPSTVSNFAKEIWDPRGWSSAGGADNCPSNYTCRYSDVALFKHNTPQPSNVGYIAKSALFVDGIENLLKQTHRTANGSYEITTVAPWPWKASQSNTNRGQLIYKVGYRTGQTLGRVTETCVTSILPTNKSAAVCQFVAGQMISAKGDSGSPVFSFVGDQSTSNQVELSGIVSAITPVSLTEILDPLVGDKFIYGTKTSFSYAGLILGQTTYKSPLNCIKTASGINQSDFCDSPSSGNRYEFRPAQHRP